ncbi:MAG: DUF1801 domain-containing protein [Pseudomonadota bacterium]
MSDMKMVETDADPKLFLEHVEPKVRAEDAAHVSDIMARVSGSPPRIWGDSIIGFGAYNYKRRDGSAHRFFRTGVAPRKANLSIHIMPGLKKYPGFLEKLGPHKASVSCLYITRLARVDTEVLEALIAQSLADMAVLYPD